MDSNKDTIVRSLLIPIRGGKLLVPSAIIAEVTSLRGIEEIPENPYDWLDGIIHWRGQRIPLLNVEKVLALPPSKKPKRQRLVVLYGLEIGQTIPFYALLASDIPRTLILTEDSLTTIGEGKRHSGIVFHAKVQDEENVWLPDLNYLEQLLKESSSVLH
jgi:chemosensory pili system protein ChpC